MGVYRDISERKQAEETLRAKDAELFAAAEIQARLLPQESPQVPGFDIAGRLLSRRSRGRRPFRLSLAARRIAAAGDGRCQRPRNWTGHRCG